MRSETGEVPRWSRFPRDRSLDRATVYTPFPEPILDNDREQILFDPEDPSVTALVDALPGDVKIDHFGQIRSRSEGLAWLVLILPVLTVLLGVGFLLV